MTSEHALDIESVSIRFGTRTILDCLNLTVTSGESVAIQGRSGSGKSTLLSAILGIARPTAGTIHVDGHNPAAMNRRELARFRSQTIGMVFQHAELIESMTAVENVALPALLIGMPRDRAVARAQELLDAVAVPDAPTVAADLSGGERQRTALARALVNEPRLLLADEPTGALDAELRDSAAALLYSLPSRTGCSLVVVTHDPAVAHQADRQLHLDAGRLSSSATPTPPPHPAADPSPRASRR
jgi:putative ABC transport system ATP-binding protein/lipoprotein-releasing system ATP-binding protein